MKIVSRKTGGFESMDIMPSSANEYLKAQALILVGEWHLAVEDESWLGDHKVQHDVVFSLAGYLLWRGKR
jgi:hypothetical protein